MIAVVQVVNTSQVTNSEKNICNKIDSGLLVFLGISTTDTENEAYKLAQKIANLRVFPDKNDKMNLSIQDTSKSILLIPQFTLLGDLKGNNRPDFTRAAGMNQAIKLISEVKKHLFDLGLNVEDGFFGENMRINSELQGPVTIIIDTSKI